MHHDLIIVMATHSSYIDICKNFLELIKKNWADCPYRIIIALTGDDVEDDFGSCEKYYCGKQSTLTDCIRKVSDIYKFKYYMCFLGDAFLSKKVSDDDVKDFVDEIEKLDIDYCCLYPKVPIKKCKMAGKWTRYINSLDRYSHSFIAYIASKRFIDSEFGLGSNDLKFEVKYLKIASEKNEYYFDKHVILKNNIFNIKPGIVKGKWDRIVLSNLRRNNPEIDFAYRPKISIFKQLLLIVRKFIFRWLPKSYVVKMSK